MRWRGVVVPSLCCGATLAPLERSVIVVADVRIAPPSADGTLFAGARVRASVLLLPVLEVRLRLVVAVDFPCCSWLVGVGVFGLSDFGRAAGVRLLVAVGLTCSVPSGNSGVFLMKKTPFLSNDAPQVAMEISLHSHKKGLPPFSCYLAPLLRNRERR